MTHIHILSRRTILKGAAAVPVAGLGIAALSRSAGAQDDPVNIGSKDFPEQFILSNMFGQVLENAGISVNLDNLNLGGTNIAHTALTEGDIDLYAEYTGTSFTNPSIFAQTFTPEIAGPAAANTPAAGATPLTSGGTPAAGGDAFSPADLAVYDYVVTAYADLGIVVLDETPFNNNQAIAVTRQFSEENSITTLSQLAEWGIDNDITMSGPVDFEDRPDGLAGLRSLYGGGFDGATVNGVDPGLKYDAFLAGDANVVLAFGTDAEIVQFDLIVLQDDLGLFPPGHAAPLVRQEAIDAYPNIPDLINPVIALLTTEAMLALNAQVVTDGGDPADVSRQFLVDSGIITG